ncbi:MAG: ArsR/SmtB family transcription factor [Pseudanabaenaceae cyanobacterium]
MAPETLAHIADYFKVLGKVSRLQVLCALKSGRKNVTQLVESTGLGQANVSKNLKLLTQAGIVRRLPQGNSVFYEISNPIIFAMCDLIYQSLGDRLRQQSQQLQQWERMR